MSIALFRRYPLAWRFRYVESLPVDRVRSSLVFGAAIHAAIEYWFRERLTGEPEPAVDRLPGAFWAAWHDRQKEAQIDYARGESHSTIHHLTPRVLEAFVVCDIARPVGSVVGVEEKLRGRIIHGVPDLLARIDLLVGTGDRSIVTDFKTAQCRWAPSGVERMIDCTARNAPLAFVSATDFMADSHDAKLPRSHRPKPH